MRLQARFSYVPRVQPRRDRVQSRATMLVIRQVDFSEVPLETVEIDRINQPSAELVYRPTLDAPIRYAERFGDVRPDGV
jgi:hypothetical protein